MDYKTFINRTKTRIRNMVWAEKRIKNLLPAGLRHMLSQWMLKTFASKTEKAQAYQPGAFPDGINLYGFFRAENGLGQGVKLYAEAVRRAGIPNCLLNTDFLDWLPQNDRSLDDRLTKENKYAINVVHINPDQWQEAVGMYPRAQFDRHYNIGVFLWELESVPDRWIPIFDQVDEIWAPSRFVAEAIRKSTEKPVTIVPYGIDTQWDESIQRADFGLNDNDFLVLLMFDSNSFSSRKNPGAAIEAFREAFGARKENKKLVVKINNPTAEDVQMIREKIGDDNSFVLITERMDRKKLNSLIRMCDVYISLHRSEGFGLVMAEAMSLGVPVVATNWSSNTEFMPGEAACMVDYTLIPVGKDYQFENDNLVWADADVHQAAAYLRNLHDNPDYRRRIATAGQRFIHEHFSMEQSGGIIQKRIEEILHSGT